MSSSLVLRLLVVVVVFAALATEVHLISGLDLEETRGPIELERVSSSSSLGRSSFPQLYNLYMDPVRKGLSSSSSFDVVHPQKKRSRLFVGKRINNDDDYFSDDEDLILVSDDNNDEPFDVKRNHLFVGKRASPRFVGKRSAANQPSRMTRRKRFASNEYGGGRGDGKGMMEDSDEGSRMWKLWMTAGTGEEEEGNAAADKRARMFVGKRRQMEEADDRKRSRLFVGRRAESEDEEKDSGIAEGEGAAKRSRLFVGKRHPEDHTSVEGFNTKEADTMHGGSPPMAAGAGGPTDDKRIHLFPGKRPAPGFVGKRED